MICYKTCLASDPPRMKNKCALEIILDVMIRVTEIVGGIFTLMMPVCVEKKKLGPPNFPREIVDFARACS